VTGSVLGRLLDPAPLRPTEIRQCFGALLEPGSDDAARASLLTALAARRVGIAELAGFAREMRRRARPFRYPEEDAPIDLCGTGGAPRPSFNVSTVSAFVVAAAGAPVIKHGNRSARGICGSSDLLLALGLPVTTSVPFARSSYRRHRLAFLHAPLYHPATAAVASARKLLGIPTIFNRLGPLSNPARVPFQVVGTPDAESATLFAGVLPLLGVRRGLALTSADRCDEFSPRSPTSTWGWSGKRHSRQRILPEGHLTAAERTGPWGPLPPKEAARECERILAGSSGARRGAVVLTSAAALRVAGMARTLPDGVRKARAAIDDGRAAALLESMRELATSVGEEGR
jgi:anthranilate phosphoribosyltransferase